MAEERLKVIWTDDAIEDYRKIVDYLSGEWSFKIAESFVEMADAKIDRLSLQPFVGRLSEKYVAMRSVIVGRYNRLYYKVYRNHIELLGFIDMRMDPSKNKFKK